MNDSTRHILRWCAGGNRGMRTNLARLLSHGRLAGTGTTGPPLGGGSVARPERPLRTRILLRGRRR